MAKSKYDKNTFPTLAEGWAREGLTDKQIAHNLDISKSTLESYKVKYPDFLDSLKRGKGPVDFEVENALLKRALGYDYDEVHEEIKTEEYAVKQKGADPATAKSVVTKTFTTKKVIIKHIVPDVTAQIYWLKNRKPAQWRDRIDDGGSNPEDMGDMLKQFSALIREGDTNG